MILLKIKICSFVDDVKMCIKRFFKFIFGGIMEIIVMALITIYSIVYKIFTLAVGVTNLLFVASVIMLILNIVEYCKNEILFTETKYFKEMLMFALIHTATYFIYKLLSIKKEIIDK